MIILESFKHILSIKLIMSSNNLNFLEGRTVRRKRFTELYIFSHFKFMNMLNLKCTSYMFSKRYKNYKNFCEIVKPDAICIDYEVNPLQIRKEIKIPFMGK